MISAKRKTQSVERAGSPFDGMAEGYDAGFTHSALGQLMREAVWARLDAAFAPGEHVLELSCGTGEDAIHLARRGVRVLTTDVSAGMLAVAQAKVTCAGLAHMVELQHLDIASLSPCHPVTLSPCHPVTSSGHFDGAFSNFGGLNCVADQAGVAAGLAQLLRPGARALLCVMGPLVPWEWAWYLGRGQPAKALRRLRPGGVQWRGLTIRYPSIGTLLRACAPHFRPLRGTAIGALLPPSYVEPWAKEHPLLLHALDRIERRFERAWPLPWLADHYLIELECM